MLPKLVHFQRFPRLGDKTAYVALYRTVLYVPRLHVIGHVAAVGPAVVTGQAGPVSGLLPHHFGLNDLVQL